MAQDEESEARRKDRQGARVRVVRMRGGGGAGEEVKSSRDESSCGLRGAAGAAVGAKPTVGSGGNGPGSLSR